MSMWLTNDAGDPLDDAALIAEIAQFRKAIRETASGGGVGVIAGEGRRVEFTRSNVALAQAALRDLLAEARRRSLPIGGSGGGAIAVEIGG